MNVQAGWHGTPHNRRQRTHSSHMRANPTCTWPLSQSIGTFEAFQLWEGNKALGKLGISGGERQLRPHFLPTKPFAPLTHALTSIKQFLDGPVVISEDSIVQGCATLEAGTVVQPVVEVILSGDQD